MVRKHVGDVKAVDGIDLVVYPVKPLVWWVESGCGKSTAGRTIVKLHEPTGGTIEYDGRDIAT
jgi:ABC-type oligopeptide transport system ATPase subunit